MTGSAHTQEISTESTFYINEINNDPDNAVLERELKEIQEKREIIRHLTDINYISDKYLVRASSRCKTAIEKKLEYAYRWTNGFLEPLFDRAVCASPELSDGKSPNPEKPVIAYEGTKIEIQNQYGAWVRNTYICVFDVNSESVIGTNIIRGILPQ